MPCALAPLLLTGCGGDSSGPTPPVQLVWSSVASGTTQNIHGVWGTSASDVWAVGWGNVPNVWTSGTSGTLLHGAPGG